MRPLNSKELIKVRLTNLELLLGVLTFSLVIYLGSILPQYRHQINILQEEKKDYIELIQMLSEYETKEEEWKKQDAFLDLCMKGYALDFPKEVDEYTLLDIIEKYLSKWPLEDLEITLVEVQELSPFKHYIYKVGYRSQQRTTKEIVYALSLIHI